MKLRSFFSMVNINIGNGTNICMVNINVGNDTNICMVNMNISIGSVMNTYLNKQNEIKQYVMVQ